MKKTFRVTFKYNGHGEFKAVNGTTRLENINWLSCPIIKDCAIARFLHKNLPEYGDIKTAKVTIEFD